MTGRETTKAVILAAGLGTRMRKNDGSAALDEKQAAVAESGVKALIPIDRPFLDYVLTVLADAGYTQVCLVIGPTHDALRKYYSQEVHAKRLTIGFAVQGKPLGTADAVLAAEEFAAGDRFLMINSDNYYPFPALSALRKLHSSGIAAFERTAMLAGSNIPADRLTKFAVAKVGVDGCLDRVIEKPDEATIASLGDEVLLSMNCWLLSRSIFDACRRIKPSPRGEMEITDAVQLSIDSLGERFRVIKSESAVLDMSNRGDIAGVAAKLAGTRVAF